MSATLRVVEFVGDWERVRMAGGWGEGVHSRIEAVGGVDGSHSCFESGVGHIEVICRIGSHITLG